MSGICGWIGGGGQRDADSVLAAMAAGLPDHSVALREDFAEPTAALAVRTRDREGACCRDGDLIATLEGYPRWNDPELAALAHAEGNGRALARAYRSYGKDLLTKLRGPFSIAILDAAANKALLAIDRFGIQPLCYAIRGDGSLVFGSTTDSLRPFPGMTSTITPQTVYNFLYFVDRIPAPATVYEEQKKLRPGECLVYEDCRAETSYYWRMPYREQGENDLEGLSAQLNERLRDAIGRNLDGENTDLIGAFLSGGLDSSSVAGIFAELAPGKAKTFTIGFGHDSYDETPYAQIAADHFKTDHKVYVVTPQDMLEVMTKVHEIYDEPFANSSAVPAYYCALKAKEAGLDVMLAGDGGDELFGGNSRYLSDAVFDRYESVPKAVRRGLLEPLLALVPPPLRRGVIGQAVNYTRFANMTVGERMIRNNAYAKVPASEIYSDQAMAVVDPQAPVDIANRLIESAPTESKFQRMFHLDMQLTLADSDLRKVGRMCELAGVRVRYPLLDDDLAEFSAGIDPEVLMLNGKLRGFYKRAMEGFLPDKILTKPKHGFGIPCLEYVAEYPSLADFFFDVLSGLKKRKVYRASFIDDIITRARAGDTLCHRGALWDLSVMEIWLRSRDISPS